MAAEEEKNKKQKMYKTIELKFSPELYQSLRAEATAELRTVNLQIIFLLEEHYRTPNEGSPIISIHRCPMKAK